VCYDNVYYEMDMYSRLRCVKIKFVYYDSVYYEIYMYFCLKYINVYFRCYEMFCGWSLSIVA